MPNVPKWVANQMENLLSSKYLDVAVAETVNYSPEIKKITFRGDLSRVDFHPGSSMVFRASDTELRHYTPSALDREKGTFEILFHIHSHGPGSRLADRLMPGDRLKVSAPGGRKLYDKDRQFHFFFGDETSLSFYDALLAEISRNHQQVRGIFELNEINRNVPEQLGYDVMTVLKTPEEPARKAITLLETYITAEPELFERSVFYLTGNVASVQTFRTALKRHGVSSRNIKLQGYWSEGSVGL
jgi:NADPH-dependent ferric siderophore reductase